jgi:hydroxypyruvate isomerase
MPRFAANLSMLYTEHDFLDRYAAAARDGFKAVECLFPYEHAPAVVAARLKDAGLQQVLFNLPPGDWAAGERGLACVPGRETAFRDAMRQALEYADALDCPRLHVMAGVAPEGVDAERVRDTLLANLCWASTEAMLAGRLLTIEPINPRDVPGFCINRQAEAHAVVQEVAAATGRQTVQVQMDLYHCQIVEGDVAMKIRQYLPTGRVGHFQIAGVPERHEPDVGELNLDYLFGVIDEVSAECGWNGWVGCEYRPARGAVPNGTTDGLGWLKRRLAAQLN